MTDTRKGKRAPALLAKQIGETARTARLAAALTQEDVAERVRLATEVYGRLERGKMLPSVPTLYRICHALGVSSDAVLGLGAAGGETKPLVPSGSLKGSEDPLVGRILRKLRRMDPERLRIVNKVSSRLPDLSHISRKTRRTTTR
jgi:transcriptional regulator with XRE-family HTH domain